MFDRYRGSVQKATVKPIKRTYMNDLVVVEKIAQWRI
jgi:hypothetical protein